MRAGRIAMYRLFRAILFATALSLTAAEDDGWETRCCDDDELNEVVTIEEKDALLDQYTAVIFSTVFALCISFAGAFVAYFSVLEDRLLSRYLSEEATIVEGSVIEAEVARSVPLVEQGSRTCGKKRTVVREFAATVEYKFTEAGGFHTIVRKQMKVLETDFYCQSKNDPSSSGCINHLDNSHHPHNKRVQILIDLDLSRGSSIWEDEDEEAGTSSSNAVVHDGGSGGPVRRLSVIVLPGHARSGLPQKHVERAYSLRKRWPTAALVMFIFSLTAFCIYLGTSAFSDVSLVGGWYHVALTSVVLLGMEFAVIDCFLRISLEKSLEEDYLESGVMVIKQDDETITTASGSSGDGESVGYIGLPLSATSTIHSL